MSIKQIFQELYSLHKANINSIKSAISDIESDFSIIKIIDDSHIKEYELLFSIGLDTYLLEFSISRTHKNASYKTYKIERNLDSFGSFRQRILPNLNIVYYGAQNCPFRFEKNQPYISTNEGRYRSDEIKSHLYEFGKDYLTIMLQYEEQD